MSEGGYRIFAPRKLKSLLLPNGDRPRTNVEKNDCRDDTPTTKLIDRARMRLMDVARKEGSLTERQLSSVCRSLMKASPARLRNGAVMLSARSPDAWSSGSNPYEWALIGGAAFMMHGTGYETVDVDVAALRRLPDGTFPHDPGPVVNKNDNGHYRVDGIKVDWMYRLDDGSGPLFEQAVRTAIPVWIEPLRGYVPVATVEYAMAIRVNAGRPKDVAVFYDFIQRGLVNPRETLALIDRYVKEQ